MIDWSHWHNEPYLIGGLVALGWLYWALTGALAPEAIRAGGRDRARTIWFYAGLVVFYLAVGSPLDQVGERFLLSAHMVQHQMLVYGAAISFWMGIPAWLADRWLPEKPGLLSRLALHPITCAAVYSATLSIWHAPSLYDWALRDKNVHVIEHLMFYGAALAFWWPLLNPSTRRPALRAPVQILYLGAVTIAMTPVFAFIAFSDNVLYPTYEYAPRIIGHLSAAEDQLLGAGIMKLGGLCVMVVVSGVAFWRWGHGEQGAGGRVKNT